MLFVEWDVVLGVGGMRRRNTHNRVVGGTRKGGFSEWRKAGTGIAGLRAASPLFGRLRGIMNAFAGWVKWVPAFAGMTARKEKGNGGKEKKKE